MTGIPFGATVHGTCDRSAGSLDGVCGHVGWRLPEHQRRRQLGSRQCRPAGWSRFVDDRSPDVLHRVRDGRARGRGPQPVPHPRWRRNMDSGRRGISGRRLCWDSCDRSGHAVHSVRWHVRAWSLSDDKRGGHMGPGARRPSAESRDVRGDRPGQPCNDLRRRVPLPRWFSRATGRRRLPQHEQRRHVESDECGAHGPVGQAGHRAEVAIGPLRGNGVQLSLPVAARRCATAGRHQPWQRQRHRDERPCRYRLRRGLPGGGTRPAPWLH